MKVFLFLGLLLLLLSSAHAGKKCKIDGVVNPNACHNEENYPYCVQVESGEYECSECKYNFDCKKLGTFCRQGKCLKASFEKQCNALEFDLSGNLVYPVQGVNDQNFCGSIEYLDSSKSVHIEWLGYCLQGQCSQCIPDYNLDSLNSVSAAFYEEHWTQTLMQPGTICIGRKVCYHDSSFRTKIEEVVDIPLTLAIIFLIFLSLILMVLVIFIYCYYSRTTRKFRKIN